MIFAQNKNHIIFHNGQDLLLSNYCFDLFISLQYVSVSLRKKCTSNIYHHFNYVYNNKLFKVMLDLKGKLQYEFLVYALV